MKDLKSKRILVIGSCGTVGSELVNQLLSPQYEIKELIGIDNNESALFYQDQDHLNDDRSHFYVCDIRNEESLMERMSGIDVVFHCAALKHVILCERSPDQAIETNIHGVKNVVSVARKNHVGVVIFTSSDKAVNPTNVMGTTKLMGERIITAANNSQRHGKTIFASTRFGNVLGSNGSVVPIFHNQIKNGGPVTVTDKKMTRFVMSIEDSVRLVIDSALQAKGGEVFITKMPVLRIYDLAVAMIDGLAEDYGHKKENIAIIEIGSKPGEKLYEELMSEEETRRSLELKKYFSVMPAFKGIYSRISYDYDEIVYTDVNNTYISANETALTVNEIKALLHKWQILKKPAFKQDARYWPGDKEER